MYLYPKNTIQIKDVKKFIIIFYVVGFAGFIIPFTKELFIIITPFSLFMNVYLLAVYHKKYSSKDISIFTFLFLVGFFIEVLGVNTGKIFGSYVYGGGLGVKLFNTPMMIGINWLFLAYVATSILESLTKKRWLILVIAPLLMIVYDIFLEQAAPKTDMWFWNNSVVPIKNFISWYIVGVFFVLVLQLSGIETKNPLSSILFACQLVFFVLLTLFL